MILRTCPDVNNGKLLYQQHQHLVWVLCNNPQVAASDHGKSWEINKGREGLLDNHGNYVMTGNYEKSWKITVNQGATWGPI